MQIVGVQKGNIVIFQTEGSWSYQICWWMTLALGTSDHARWVTEVTAYDIKYFRLSERKRPSYILGFSERRKRWIRRLWVITWYMVKKWQKHIQRQVPFESCHENETYLWFRKYKAKKEHGIQLVQPSTQFINPSITLNEYLSYVNWWDKQ